MSRARAVAGVALVVAGSIVLVGSAGVLAAFGFDGSLASGPRALSTRASALVVPLTAIRHTAGVSRVAGTPRLTVSSSAGDARRGTFVGIAPDAAIARYLAGASVDRVTRLDVDPWVLAGGIRHGAVRPAAPAEQRFWVAASTSATRATVDWRIRDGRYSVVVMSADGAPGVRARGRVAVTVPRLPALSIVGMVAGLALIAGAIAGLIAGAGERPRPDPVSQSTSPVRSSR